MSNRWIRFALAVVALATAAFAAYRVVEEERRVAQDVTASRSTEFAIESAQATAADLKATLHAYVAPGQGLPFWNARATMLLDKLRSAVLAIDSAVVATGGSAGESLDAIDRLAAAEQRAREHVRQGQSLLAGEVIFSEARDLLDAISMHLARARDQIASTSGARLAETRRLQTIYLAGGAAVMALTLLILVPAGRAAQEPTPLTLASAPAPPLSQAAPSLQSPPLAAVPDLDKAAAICTAMARLSESTQLPSLLAAAADVLDASGLVVWLVSPTGQQLHPVASAGYSPRIMAQIGVIPVTADNVTAAAFRSGTSRASASAASGSALAVPMVGASGPTGVLSAEMRAGADPDPAHLAIATMFAAQLAAVLGTLPAASDLPQVNEA